MPIIDASRASISEHQTPSIDASRASPTSAYEIWLGLDGGSNHQQGSINHSSMMIMFRSKFSLKLRSKSFIECSGMILVGEASNIAGPSSSSKKVSQI